MNSQTIAGENPEGLLQLVFPDLVQLSVDQMEPGEDTQGETGGRGKAGTPDVKESAASSLIIKTIQTGQLQTTRGYSSHASEGVQACIPVRSGSAIIAVLHVVFLNASASGLPLLELQILAALIASAARAAPEADPGAGAGFAPRRDEKEAAPDPDSMQDAGKAADLSLTGAAPADTSGGPAGGSPAAIQRRLQELESLWKIGQAISAETEQFRLYRLIHEQIVQIIGDFSSFTIVLYDEATQMFSVPYNSENGTLFEIAPFPLGQGLSSIVIRNKRPLLLAESSAEKARVLGAKFAGEPAKSWLGVPLISGDNIFGLIIAQDIYQEYRFGEEDLRLLSLIATQVSIVVRNTRLIQQAKRQAEIQRQGFEITDKIRRSLDIQSILKTTADELAQTLKARSAHIKIAPRLMGRAAASQGPDLPGSAALPADGGPANGTVPPGENSDRPTNAGEKRLTSDGEP